ncbi:MAG: hypothetical protein EBT86_12900, partial [Actinobacteria bacterium]|nr:hypothetical protein [Actinomycetota bacterium]
MTTNERFGRVVNYVAHVPAAILHFITEHLGNVSAHTLGWLMIIMLHLSSVPTLLAVLTNQSDRMPPVDIMLFVWGALIAVFFKSLFEKNFLYIATICLGFCGQTVLMSLILFK